MTVGTARPARVLAAYESLPRLTPGSAEAAKMGATSVVVSAEILLRLPRKLFSFTIKKIFLQDQSIQKINKLTLKKKSLGATLKALPSFQLRAAQMGWLPAEKFFSK